MEWKTVKELIPKYDFDEKPLPTLEEDVDDYNSIKQEPRNGIECPLCLNKEAIKRIVDGEVKVEKCKCRNQRDYYDRAKMCGMGDLVNLKLDDYVASEDWQKKIKETAIHFINSNHTNWFVAIGQVGSGKTTICSIVANELMKTKTVIYVVWNDYLAKMRRLYRNEQEDYIDMIRFVEVLYLDDVLKSTNQQDTQELFNLLNYRYNNKKITIISSEKNIKDIFAIDEGIASRIIERAGDYLLTFKKDINKNQRVKGIEL